MFACGCTRNTLTFKSQAFLCKSENWNPFNDSTESMMWMTCWNDKHNRNKQPHLNIYFITKLLKVTQGLLSTDDSNKFVNDLLAPVSFKRTVRTNKLVKVNI